MYFPPTYFFLIPLTFPAFSCPHHNFLQRCCCSPIQNGLIFSLKWYVFSVWHVMTRFLCSTVNKITVYAIFLYIWVCINRSIFMKKGSTSLAVEVCGYAAEITSWLITNIILTIILTLLHTMFHSMRSLSFKNYF